MSGDGRHHTPQFKLQVVLESLRGEQSAAQIAREHGIGANLLSRWRDVFREWAPQLFQDGRGEGAPRRRASPSGNGSSGSRPSN